MDRRRFVGGIALGFVVAPLTTHAQQLARVPRIGLLAVPSFESPEMQMLLNAFREGLRERGYVERQNIVIEYRSGDGRFEQLPGLARELSQLNVDVIVVGTSQVARTVQQATTTIPIVAIGMEAYGSVARSASAR
jgi:putative tryptophan/tyrosine transport system substrate-binding protein